MAIREVSADMLQAPSQAKRQEASIVPVVKGTFHPFSKLSDCNLQTAVACNNEGETGFSGGGRAR